MDRVVQQRFISYVVNNLYTYMQRLKVYLPVFSNCIHIQLTTLLTKYLKNVLFDLDKKTPPTTIPVKRQVTTLTKSPVSALNFFYSHVNINSS